LILLITLLLVLRRSRRKAAPTPAASGYGYGQYNPYSMPLPGYGAPLPPSTGGPGAAPTPAELLDVSRRTMSGQPTPGQSSSTAVATAAPFAQRDPSLPPPSGAWASPQQLPAPPPPVDQGMCVNGHSMPAGEIYCGICGAPRRTNSGR